MRTKGERGGRGAFAPGDMIAGRYVVVCKLGEGGMGVVYKCFDRVGGVTVAVKCLPPEVSRNEDEMEDIRVNYQLVRQLRHQNIAGATSLEKDESTGDYYLVMDIASGISLKRWMRRNPHATRLAKLAILRQVAAALDYAHARRVIHRDVKPENVMVDDEGGVKVLDFGLAAKIRSSQSRTSKTVSSRSGTWGYMSPEQWRAKPQREQSDVYSFGVMAYWMFASVLPFEGDDPMVLGQAVLTEPVEPVAGLPGYMNAALVKALAKKPENRFASCGEVVAALEGRVAPQGERIIPQWGRITPQLGCATPKVGRITPKAVRIIPKEGRITTQLGSATPQVGGAQVGGVRPPQYGGAAGCKKRNDGIGKVLVAVVMFVVAMGIGYYGRAKYEEGVANNEAKERAWINESPNDSPVEKENGEPVTAVSNAPAGSVAGNEPLPTNGTSRAFAEEVERRADEAHKRAAELMNLKKQIVSKTSAAKRKMDSVEKFRSDPELLLEHIESADSQWNKISSIAEPANLDVAKTTLDIVTNAEAQIALELAWLEKNKAGRDTVKAVSAEIDKLLQGDVVTFNAKDNASKAYGEGLKYRKQGEDAAKRGEFADAGRLMGQAKEKFTAAARDAKASVIKTTLKSAKACFEASKWDDCTNECAKVLGWDGSNEKAKRLKEDAENRLVPSVEIVIFVEGDIKPLGGGETVKIGDTPCTTPIKWGKDDIKMGVKYVGRRVSYERGGRRYSGELEAFTVDRPGLKRIRVDMAEEEGNGVQHGQIEIITLPGGETMEMIYVKAGPFIMGSPETELGRHGSDEAQRQVTLTQGFWLGKYEVTQAQWESVMGCNPSLFKDNWFKDNRLKGAKRPAVGVTWEDCRNFIQKINSEYDYGARLPTEAEWEYSCRAESTGAYGRPGEKLNDTGWYSGNSGGVTHDVGQKKPNKWGFYDMHGNVWEWCEGRVLRGGGYHAKAEECRSAFRNIIRDDLLDDKYGLGFRIRCSRIP